MRFRPRNVKKGRFRCFFATDIHGSDRCFRKFLAAFKVYEANALVLGGDVVGKAIVPIVRAGDGAKVTFQSDTRQISEDEIPEIQDQIATNGLYPWICGPEDVRRLNDSNFRDQLFEKLITEQLRGWCDLAAERLPDDVVCVITPGNDDPRSIDSILSAATRVACPEQQVMELGPIALASLGNVNPTPWSTDREYPESELAEQIDTMLNRYDGTAPYVFNFHCPPYASGLDTVTLLDNEFRPVIEHGVPVEAPAGSTAVSDAIKKWKPVAGLHGHIHEVTAHKMLDGTMCMNPGSEYATGALKGLLVDFDSKGNYVHHLFTRG